VGEPSTVIVPLFVKNEDPVTFAGPRDLIRHYYKLLREAEGNFSFLILDNSPPEVSGRLREICLDTNIPYALLPQSETRAGNNRKLDAVRYALGLTVTEKTILFDDDIRPTGTNIERITDELEHFTLVKCIIDFISPNTFDRIDLAGICAFNQLSRHKQNWGNISFLKSTLLERGFPSSNLLYDELAIERTIRRGQYQECYISDLPIPMKSSGRSLGEYLRQRIRYAYENIAFPVRFFAFDILLLFAVLGIAYFWSAWMSVLVIALVSAIVICASYTYQRSLAWQFAAGRVWPYAPLWYWPYPFCSCCALVLFFRGGILFGGNRIRRPCIW
jgi:hypothetical protein